MITVRKIQECTHDDADQSSPLRLVRRSVTYEFARESGEVIGDDQERERLAVQIYGHAPWERDS